MRFRDRTQAGRELAKLLAPVVSKPCVVAAVPRGGVVVAVPVAERLSAPLTVVYARKLSPPWEPELAFGAIDDDELRILDDEIVSAVGIDPAGIERVASRVAAEVRRRMQLYRAPRLADFLPGRSVVLVDDGLATGLTMRAAVQYAHRHGAVEVIVAAPCGAADTCERMEREGARIVCPVVDPGFRGVSGYYVDFSPVTDDEVVALLARAREGSRPAATGRV